MKKKIVLIAASAYISVLGLEYFKGINGYSIK